MDGGWHVVCTDGQEAQVVQRDRLWSMVAALGGPVRGVLMTTCVFFA